MINTWPDSQWSAAELPEDLPALDAWLQTRESAEHELKPDNQARLVFHDPAKPVRTEISFVYIHGFSASPGEAGTQPQRLGRQFAGNVYVARLPGHGTDRADAMAGLTADRLYATADQALAMGRRIGERVVMIGTSLGAALSIDLAARDPSGIAAVIAWSPAIRPSDAAMMQYLCTPGDAVEFSIQDRNAGHRQYWSSVVHRDAYRSLAGVLGSRMCEATFRRVFVPFLLAYFYRDETTQDRTASVEAMLEMYEGLGTDDAHKRKIAFSNGAHALASPSRSPDAEAVFEATRRFLIEIAGIPAVG
ncbi:MAG: alpha/beta hydrolase [Tahibacter sp.]